jgi:FtsZ-interacting cell division protein ZipA
MNLIILLAILAITAALVHLLFRRQREECHNAEDAPKAKTKKAETPAEVEKEKTTTVIDEQSDEIPEAEIRAKMAAGLDREQAVEVINNQRAWDKQQAAAV